VSFKRHAILQKEHQKKEIFEHIKPVSKKKYLIETKVKLNGKIIKNNRQIKKITKKK
jgi:hypothetical protein